MGASVVTCGDAAPVLKAAEHVLDAVALSIKHLVVGKRDLAAFGGGDARRDAASRQIGAEAVAVVSTVGDQVLRRRQRGQDQRRSPVVAHLTFRQQQDDGTSLAVADGVQLGVQTTFGAPDTTGNSPFFSKLAAVR